MAPDQPDNTVGELLSSDDEESRVNPSSPRRATQLDGSVNFSQLRSVRRLELQRRWPSRGVASWQPAKGLENALAKRRGLLPTHREESAVGETSDGSDSESQSGTEALAAPAALRVHPVNGARVIATVAWSGPQAGKRDVMGAFGTERATSSAPFPPRRRSGADSVSAVGDLRGLPLQRSGASDLTSLLSL